MESLNGYWASFFEVLASFLIFGIGIPSLIIQAIIAEDVKKIAFQNDKLVFKHSIPVVIFGICIVLFIWVLNPVQLQFDSIILKSLPFLNEKYIQLIKLFPYLNAYIVAAAIMTVILFLLLYMWWGQFLYSRKSIIERERKTYIRQVEQSVRRIKVSNIVNRRWYLKLPGFLYLNWINKESYPNIRGIHYLGENGAAGGEKELALKAFRRIVIFVFDCYQNNPPAQILIDIVDAIRATLNANASNSNYLRGIKILEYINSKISAEYVDRRDIFIEMIKAIEASLKTGDINERKYHTGIRALKEIISASIRIDETDSPALVKGLQTINRLAEIAYEEDYRVEISQIIGVIASTSLGPDNFTPAAARILLEQGAASLTGKYYDIALEILNRFETMMEEYTCLEAETAQFYLGLVALFWCSGNAARQRALEGLKRKRYNKTEFAKCLHKVRDLHYCAARFETADKLDIMIKEFAKVKI